MIVTSVVVMVYVYDQDMSVVDWKTVGMGLMKLTAVSSYCGYVANSYILVAC